MSAAERPLGRLYPKHFDHVEKYSLDVAAHTPGVQPVAPGTNWYEAFDSPAKGQDGKWRIRSSRLGNIRGGHCYCLCPPTLVAKDIWQRFYNQGQEGACEGFGHSRRFSLLTGKTFDAFHLYDDAQRIEGTYVPNGGSADEGSTNDACCQALKKWGVHPQTGDVAHRVNVASEPHPAAISTYRWATTAGQILTVLGISSGGEIPLLNSWGEDYPHVVYMPPEVLERLLHEGGECDVITDR